MSWSSGVLQVVDESLPSAATTLFEQIQAEVPVYAGELSGAVIPLAQEGIEQALGRFGMRLADPGLADDPGWRSVIDELGRSAQRAGRSLEALLAAYRVGARLAWREISTAGAAAGVEPEELYRLAEELFIYIDQLSSVSAAGYAAEQAQAAGQRQQRRRSLVALLVESAVIEPAVLADAARQAGWPVPAEVAVVAVDRDDVERIAGRIDPMVLAGAGGVLLVPDPMARGRIDAVQRAVASDGARAALGPVVTVQDARVSWARAERALLLLREGLLSADDGLVRADDVLLELLLHRDERLLADIATRTLRGLNELAPKTRERLLETLRAFLDHEGRMDPTAHALGVHPQTVRYRVTQLRELLGRTLEEPDGRLLLSLALRVRAPAAPPLARPRLEDRAMTSRAVGGQGSS